MLRTVKVYGHLAEHCGQSVFEALVRVPADAIKFLLCNFPELRSLMRDGYYKVAVGKFDLQLADHPEQLHYPMAADDVVKVIPVVSGAGGRGLGQILLGAALIGVHCLWRWRGCLLGVYAKKLRFLGLLVWLRNWFADKTCCSSRKHWPCFNAWRYRDDDYACAATA